MIAGLENLQIARELLGSDRPLVHLNCVLTRENAWGFPELIRLILQMKKQRTAGYTGGRRGDPHFRDLGVHLVPVGGPQNAGLRLTADEVRRFYEETWPRAAAVWEEYEVASGVPVEERVPFNDWAFFASAWRRVRHQGSLEDYARHAKRATTPGWPWVLAATSPQPRRLCSGRQPAPVRAHYISRPAPVGNVLEASLMENIRRSLAQVAGFPALLPQLPYRYPLPEPGHRGTWPEGGGLAGRGSTATAA